MTKGTPTTSTEPPSLDGQVEPETLFNAANADIFKSPEPQEDDAMIVVKLEEEKGNKSIKPKSSSTTPTALPAHDESFSQRWTSAIDTVRILICRALKAITHWSATHPRTTVVAVTIFSIGMIMTGLATNFRVETNGDILWPPRGSTTQIYQNWIEQDSGFSEELYYSVVYIHSHGENILTNAEQSLEKVFEVYDAIRDLPDYSKVCDQPYTDSETNVTTKCAGYGVFEFWFSSTKLFDNQVKSDQDAIEHISASHFPTGKPVDPARVFGTPTYDPTTGLLTHCEAYRFDLVYPRSEEVDEFLSQVIDVTLAQSNDIYQVEVLTSRSFDDEFQRAIVKDIPLMPMAFIVMSVFCCIVFWRWDRVRSQTLLGWGAVVSVLFSVMTGYGILFLCGIPMTSATQIVVFVMFGIGLDDAFIISGSYSRTDPTKDPVERVADTIDDIGLAITITTLTSALAFATGCISSINAVYWLCLYAFPTIIIDFLYQITFFLALVVIDERRMQRNKMDCLICVSVDKEEESEEADNNEESEEANNTSSKLQLEDRPASRSSRFMTWYADKLLQPCTKATVLVTFTSLLGACIWGATQLRQEMDFVDLVPHDSHVTGFFDAQDEHFQEGLQVSTYFRFVNQSDPGIRKQMKDYLDDLKERGAIMQDIPYFWVPDFEAFVANDNSTDATTFNEQLDAFLSDPLYSALYSDDIVRDKVTGDVVSSRCDWIYMDIDTSNSRALIDQLALLGDIAGSQPINEGIAEGDFRFFVHDVLMNMWEFYSVVPKELTFTTVVGVVAVSIIGVAFVPHWTAVFFVVPSIVTVYIDLLGFLHFVGVRINPVSYITLVMSIGLLVDFVMHILLRYYECHEGNRENRVRETLVTMGSSILIGGISTFLGVMLLAFSTSEIFSTIFRAFIGLVLLGLSYGLILIPVVLSLVGPEDGYEKPVEAEAEPTPLSESVQQAESTKREEFPPLYQGMSDEIAV